MLIQTDFPEPVVPAIKRCGIETKSPTIGKPEILLPSVIGILISLLLNSLLEIISFKAIYGGLRDENNPDKNTTGNFKLPSYENGSQRTYSLSKEPYMEGSVGLGNIFKVLRVDLVKRFNYLNNPEVTEWGIRARVKLDF